MEREPPKESVALGERLPGWMECSEQWGVLGGHTDSGHHGSCHTLQVYVKISVPKGIQFVGHPGKRHLTKKTCVVPGEMEPSWVVLSFGDLGLSNITGEGHVLLGAAPLSRPPRGSGAESRHG